MDRQCSRRWWLKGRVPFLALLVAVWSQPALAQVEMSGMWQSMPRNQDGSGLTGDAAGVPGVMRDRGEMHLSLAGGTDRGHVEMLAEFVTDPPAGVAARTTPQRFG